jgi:hypothetical protein
MTTVYGRLIIPNAEPALAGAPSEPQSGATLTVYLTGTTTLASLFSDQGMTPASNPQTANSAGLFYKSGTVLWADASEGYDCVLVLPSGQTYTYLALYLVGPTTNVTGFAPINSPAFTGAPTAPTTALNNNSTALATTGYVQGQGFATTASPTFTGTPAVPTAPAGTNTTQAASTAFVTAAVGAKIPTGVSSGFAEFGGMILQWTTFSLGAAGGASQAVTWPLPFPTNVVGLPWVSVTNAAIGMIGVTNATVSGATINKSSTDTSARTGTVWAYGY